MRYTKILLFALLLSISLATITLTPIMGNVTVVNAASIKISKKTLSLNVGDSKTLKILGINKKVTWTSSNKSIATVTSKGKVTAKSAGNATITATVNGKKYTCKLSVADTVSSATVK